MRERLYTKGDDASAGIVFADKVAGFALAGTPGRVLHILYTRGGMSFMLHDVRYNVAAGDYVILPDAALASDITESADAEAMVMSLSESFVASLALRSNYGIIGHLSLLQNPVMRLSPGDFSVCREAMATLRRRMDDSGGHLFRDEMLRHLLMAHILDLYDIHGADDDGKTCPNGRKASCGGSSRCSITANTSPTATSTITPRASASRRTTSPRCAAKRADAPRLTGLTALRRTG